MSVTLQPQRMFGSRYLGPGFRQFRRHTAQLVVSVGKGIDPVVLTLNGNAGLYYDANDDGLISLGDLPVIINLALMDGVLNYTGRKASVKDIAQLIDYLLTSN